MPRPTTPHTATAKPTHTRDERRQISRTEDSNIIRQALKGDETAYKKLLKKYHDAIFNFIFRMVHDRQQVEDLTQEAFIKAFSSLDKFNDEYAFSTWLYKIATNNSIDYIRKKKLQAYSIDKPIDAKDSEYAFELPDEDYEADKELISDQRATLLRNAIAKLPEKYRKVIEMRHVEETSYEEISEELDLPIGTVKAHIFRARELLYKQLKTKILHY